MKIVAINGSGTGAKGATGQALEGVLEGVRESGAEVELFLLNELKITPCTGCGTCKRTGQCVFKDDYLKIKDAMLAVDGVVLASPNYISNVSSQIKAFLDRSFCFLFHCQAMNGKYGAVVVASGGPRYEPVEEYLMHVTGSMGCWRVGSIVAATAQMDDPDERASVMDEARVLGRNLVTAIKTKQCFPDQEEERENTFEVVRWLVESTKEEAPFEYEYWQKNQSS
jgi:multimeric flavodoxin WrbA